MIRVPVTDRCQQDHKSTEYHSRLVGWPDLNRWPLAPKARADRVERCALDGSPALMRWRSLRAMAVGGRRCYMAATQPTATWVRVVSRPAGRLGFPNPLFQDRRRRLLLDSPRNGRLPGGTTNGNYRLMLAGPGC